MNTVLKPRCSCIGQRLISMRALYIVLRSDVDTYKHMRFRQYPPIKTLEENETFCQFIATLLNEQLS
jgi:hypothetical protein